MIDSSKYKVSNDVPMKLVNVRELLFNDGINVPPGQHLDVYFLENRPDRVAFEYNGKTRLVSVSRLHDTFSGRSFSKPPGIRALERMSNDGIAKTVTGHRTEPDGYGPDGSPSWLLALSLI